jgi:hypothetical protein
MLAPSRLVAIQVRIMNISADFPRLQIISQTVSGGSVWCDHDR